MPLCTHPYFRDKQNAVATAGLQAALNSVGYTVQEFNEDNNIVAPPTILVGSNWFFGGTIGNPTGQTHTD